MCLVEMRESLIFSCELSVRLSAPLDITYILCFAQYSRIFIEPISIQKEVFA